MPEKSKSKKLGLRGDVLPQTITYLDQLANQWGVSRASAVDRIVQFHRENFLLTVQLQRRLYSGQASVAWKDNRPPEEIIAWVEAYKNR